MERSATGLGAPELAQLLGRALAALWGCAHLTLGDLTLCAIFQRVIFNARSKFPALALLRLEPHIDSFRELATGRPRTLDRDELVRATDFVLTQLLTVFDHLTAAIVTPALQAELSNTGLADKNPAAPAHAPKSAERSGVSPAS